MDTHSPASNIQSLWEAAVDQVFMVKDFIDRNYFIQLAIFSVNAQMFKFSGLLTLAGVSLMLEYGPDRQSLILEAITTTVALATGLMGGTAARNIYREIAYDVAAYREDREWRKARKMAENIFG